MKTRPDQAEKRTVATIRDQHDRPWDATLDTEPKARLGFCTPPIPKFSAPILPPQEYLRPVLGEFGSLRIDYDAWIAELQMASDGYTRQLRSYALQHYKGQMVGEVLRNPPPDLIAMVGEAPPPLDFARAARAGNKWVLGLRKSDGSLYPMPTWAKPIAHVLEPKRAGSLLDDVLRYADDEDDDVNPFALDDESAEILADRAKYQDDEETADPDALGGHTVSPRRAGRRSREARQGALATE